MSNETAKLPKPAQKALEALPIVMGGKNRIGVAWAPGRVNLIGEHTDYNYGFVLPIAVDKVVALAGGARHDRIVRLCSSHFQEYAQFSLDGLPSTFGKLKERLPRWAVYIMAVIAELMRIGVPLGGFEAVVNGDVPVGGGMSSSAALEIATTQFCTLISGGQLRIAAGDLETLAKPIEIATLCQRAEHLASDVQSGILDQAASCLGRPGKAILLDCRSLEYRYLPFETHDLSIVVIDTNVHRELATSAYNERRSQCEEAVQRLRELIEHDDPGKQPSRAISSLRDITQEQLDQFSQQLPDVLRRRASYVIAENARVLEAAKLLEQGKIAEIGPLLWESHNGLRYEYEVSCFELDMLVEIARRVPGVLGGRMMGGGFGGCTINLVGNDAIDSLERLVNTEYPARTGLHPGFEICHAASGPGMRWIN